MIEWYYFKQLLTSKSLYPQYIENNDIYHLKLYEGPIKLAECIINKNQNIEDKQDFENNYKSLSNQSVLNQFDTDGAQIVRIKAAKRGWTYGAIPMEFKTAEIGSLWSKTSDGQNREGISLKFYDANGQEITEEGLLQVNETTIIRSIVDFEPPYDYEVIGGTLRVGSDIAFDCRLWIVAVPDIPANLGGSKEMAGGINLKFLAPQQLMNVDGRVSKTLTYSPTLHTNKLRFIFEHQAGSKVDIHLNVELYRQ
jgi:hypothetical protein